MTERESRGNIREFDGLAWQNETFVVYHAKDNVDPIWKCDRNAKMGRSDILVWQRGKMPCVNNAKWEILPGKHDQIGIINGLAWQTGKTVLLSSEKWEILIVLHDQMGIISR